MIIMRRSGERHHVRRANRDRWSSFHAARLDDGLALGFGALQRFDEHRLEAGSSVLVRPAAAIEVISYVLSGVVSCRESARRTALLHAGDFQRVSGGGTSGVRQTNASRSHAAHVFQLWLCHPFFEPKADSEQRHFSAAERRGGLRVVASRDASGTALSLCPQVQVYSSFLEAGQNLVHELGPRRSAWLHVVQGEVIADISVLCAGDAASFTLEPSVSITALMPSEVLLVDLTHLVAVPE